MAITFHEKRYTTELGLSVSIKSMRKFLAVFLPALFGISLAQAAPPNRASNSNLQWQRVDQLCGQVELAAPTKKEIVVNGKAETRLYATHLTNAELVLYSGSRDENKCCRQQKVLERTKSNRRGSFYLTAFHIGYYWLQIRKGTLNVFIPIEVTHEFDPTSCHDYSVGRLFIADSVPPTVITRIY
jgi:hypothetical protein